MTRYCDGTGGKLPCPHPENCTISCDFNNAEREAADQWHDIGYHLAFVMWAFVATIGCIAVGVICLVLGFT